MKMLIESLDAAFWLLPDRMRSAQAVVVLLAIHLQLIALEYRT